MAEEARDVTGSQKARAAASPALEANVSYKEYSGSVKIADNKLATEFVPGTGAVSLFAIICMKIDNIPFAKLSRGFPYGLAAAASFGASVTIIGALTHFWRANKAQAEGAITKAVKAADLGVKSIDEGRSLLVKLHCYTPQSFLQFVSDYESKKVKQRLEEELSKVGCTGELSITIENIEEVEEHKKKLRYDSVC